MIDANCVLEPLYVDTCERKDHVYTELLLKVYKIYDQFYRRKGKVNDVQRER